MNKLTKPILALITVIGAILFAQGLANAIDREFINDYAKQMGINPEHIHVADREEDCYEDEFFDDKYGLCIVLNQRFTDMDVEN